MPNSSLKEQLRTKNRHRRDRFRQSVSGIGSGRNDLLPRLQVVDVPLADISVPARNVRKVNQAHVDEVGRSFDYLGLCAPLIIDQDNTLVDGVIRFIALRQRNVDKVPCIRIDHLTRDEVRQLRLALNRLGEKGAWDLDDLRLEFTELIELDLPVEISGFDASEIDQVLQVDDDTDIEQSELEPRPGARAVARPGDRFQLGPHTVICGDATDPTIIEQLMLDQGQARLVLTDQPYNVRIKGHVTGGSHREFAMASGEMTDEEFGRFNRDWMKGVLPHLCDGGVLATFIDWRGWPATHPVAADLGLTLLNLIVWHKTNAGMGSLYRSQHELLPLYRKGTAPVLNTVELGRKGRWRSNVWSYAGASSIGSDARKGLIEHPTVKPVAMLEDALLDLTSRDDVVIDPFLGSGSTLIAAERCGRVCHGVEIDPLYVDVICRRYQTATGTPAVHSMTGLPFEELATQRATDTLKDAEPE